LHVDGNFATAGKEKNQSQGSVMAVYQARQVGRSGLFRRMGQMLAPWPLFVRGFLKDPAMVASVVPSSRVMIDAMLKPVDWANTSLFVEYGPGVGTFSRHILRRMRPDATLIAIDTSEDFARYLARDITDSRFQMVHGSAADVREIIAAHGFAEADYILSGIPFSTLPEEVGGSIAGETHAALKPGGGFLVYQFSIKARTRMAPHFERIDDGFTAWNIPPCRLFWGWKAQ
jgi:phospholipid N-methyltransferase